jgi:hypothetical protein
MNLKTSIKGTLTIRIYDEENLIEELNSNLIVNGGRTWLKDLLTNNTAAFVSYIRIGTSNATANTSNTSVTGASPDFTKSVTPSFSGDVVKYSFQILTSEANGVGINEFGLFLNNNVMIARVNRTPAQGPIPKTSSIRIEGDWKWTLTFN